MKPLNIQDMVADSIGLKRVFTDDGNLQCQLCGNHYRHSSYFVSINNRAAAGGWGMDLCKKCRGRFDELIDAAKNSSQFLACALVAIAVADFENKEEKE